MNMLTRVVELEHLKEYEDIFIKVKKLGGFQFSDIERNRISVVTSVPDFVAKFERNLERKPGLPLNVRCSLSCPSAFLF